jgi:predicted O-methyltransferase YrrM
VFLDADRSQYVGWSRDLQQSVRSGGLLVVDNATSHQGEIAPLAQAAGRRVLVGECSPKKRVNTSAILASSAIFVV